jgi:septum formation protein
MTVFPFVLASASPRRKSLIKSFPFRARVVPSRFPEPPGRRGENPRLYVIRLAQGKAGEVSRRLPGSLVLGADTIVYFKGRFLGKPKDEREARAMLAGLSGRWHDVYTGLCLMGGGKSWTAAARTRVRMRRFTEGQLDRWARRNHDKAGAYAAQAVGNPFVVDYRGDFDNVVGLPRRTLRALLKTAERAGINPAKD